MFIDDVLKRTRESYGGFECVFVCSVEDHLLLDSQITKRNTLMALKSKLLSIEWVSHTGDIHHAVLRLLVNLARRPTSSSIPEAHMLDNEAPLGRVENEELDLSDWGDEADLCGSQSDLSQWSTEEQKGQESHLEPKLEIKSEGEDHETAGGHDQTGYVPVPEGQTMALALGSHQRGLGMPPGRFGALEDLEEAPEHVGSLLHSLSRVIYSDGRPFGSCVTTEAALVRECLHVLQGIPGPVFIWTEGQRFSVLDSLHVPQFSPAALRNLLSRFADLGTKVRALGNWAQGVVWESNETAPGLQCMQMYGCVFPTLVAFADALQNITNKVICPVVKLEQGLESNPQTQSSLIYLKVLIRGVGTKVSLLDLCRKKIHESLSEKKVTPREGCKKVLDTLYTLLDETEDTGGSSGYSEQLCIWQLFCASLQPLLSNLSSWLFLGESSEVSDEFFISRNHDPSIELTEFWQRGYHTDTPSVPSFLFDVHIAIQEGGKALHVLGSKEYNDYLETKLHDDCHEDRLANLVDPNWTSDLLHNNFLRFLECVLESQRVEANITAKESVMHGMAHAGFCRSCYELPETGDMKMPWRQPVESGSDESETIPRGSDECSPAAKVSHEEEPMDISSDNSCGKRDHGGWGACGQVGKDPPIHDYMDKDGSLEDEDTRLEHQHAERLLALEKLSRHIQQSTVTDTGTAVDG